MATPSIPATTSAARSAPAPSAAQAAPVFSAQGAPSAESYEVLITIHSQLKASTPNNTTVTTTFQSMGRPVSQSGEYRTCTSTGGLEKSIGDLLRTRLSM